MTEQEKRQKDEQWASIFSLGALLQHFSMAVQSNLVNAVTNLRISKIKWQPPPLPQVFGI
jgi:hypothetical protein